MITIIEVTAVLDNTPIIVNANDILVCCVDDNKKCTVIRMRAEPSINLYCKESQRNVAELITVKQQERQQ